MADSRGLGSSSDRSKKKKRKKRKRNRKEKLSLIANAANDLASSVCCTKPRLRRNRNENLSSRLVSSRRGCPLMDERKTRIYRCLFAIRSRDTDTKENDKMHGHHKSLDSYGTVRSFFFFLPQRHERTIPSYRTEFPRVSSSRFFFPRLLSRRLCSSKELPIPRALSD